MKRRTAIRLFRFLFYAQIFGLGLGVINFFSELPKGLHIYHFGYLVGGLVGSGMAVLWYRQWKGIEAISEEKWNRLWFISHRKS